MRQLRGLFVAWLVLTLVTLGPSPGGAAPEGQMTWAAHISLAPTWFDPAETSGIITPFMVIYALHDAMLKPMSGDPVAPGLAESWSMSPDGLVYDFVLPKGVKFHNGDPVTAEDVKFSLERIRRTPWDSPSSPGASFPAASSSTGNRPATRTIVPAPSSCSPRPAIPTASTPETTSATPRSSTSASPWSTISTRRAFA